MVVFLWICIFQAAISKRLSDVSQKSNSDDSVTKERAKSSSNEAFVQEIANSGDLVITVNKRIWIDGSVALDSLFRPCKAWKGKN